MARSKKFQLVENEIQKTGSDRLHCYEHSGCVISVDFVGQCSNSIVPIRVSMISDIIYQICGFSDSLHIRVLKNAKTITRKSHVIGLAKFLDIETSDISPEGSFLSELFVIRNPELVLMLTLKYNLT